jgi:hypothetical protein
VALPSRLNGTVFLATRAVIVTTSTFLHDQFGGKVNALQSLTFLLLAALSLSAAAQTPPLATQSARTVTTAETTRINAALAAGDAAAAEVVRLTALLAAQPVCPATRTRLFVDGSQVKTKSGVPVQIRGIEHMYGVDEFNVGPVGMVARMKALGANTVSPLFQGANGSVARVTAYIAAARAAGLLVGVNCDHQSNGRAWLNHPDMVAALNAADNVFLQCEVETDDVTSDAEWVAGAVSLVQAVRAAGHLSILKVGAPQGGRRVEYALRAGQQVLSADPTGQLLFTWQAYWGSAANSCWYQSQAGVACGVAGTLAAIDQVDASPLAFLIGFDWEDDVGATGELQLMDRAHLRGLNYQHWVLTGDGLRTGNNMLDRFDWTRSLEGIQPNGILVRDKLLSQRILPVL